MKNSVKQDVGTNGQIVYLINLELRTVNNP